MEDNIIRELQEDIRRDRAKQLWDQYGTTIIGIAAAVIIGTGVGVAWKDYQSSKNQRLTGMLLAAVTQTDDEKRRSALEETAKAAGSRAQGALAQLYLAAEARESGDVKEALAGYRDVGENAKDGSLRNLGRVLAVHTAIDNSLDAEDTKPVPENNAFALSWQEAEGWKYYAAGEKDEAIKRFLSIVNDVDAPPVLRSRVLAVSSYLSPGKE